MDLYAAIEVAAHEIALFAAVGFLIGGLDDLAIDLLYALRAMRRRWRRTPEPVLDAYTDRPMQHRLAVFVPAWDESAVIGAMISTALARFEHCAYRIYVGVYPNDRATVTLVAGLALRDPRVRMVVHPAPGPTTKADCLNKIWHALREDEADADEQTHAVVLHDAEDVVHCGELQIFDAEIATTDVVQLPVLPLVDRTSPMVSGQKQAMAEFGRYCRYGRENRAERYQILTVLGKTAQPIRLAA